MSIPVSPGEPGDAKPVANNEVIGIMVNGVILDNHKATWSYDSCNGHSDTAHQYHYHLPPICFLETMGYPVPDSHKWWINDAGTEVRAYEDLAEQFPATADSGSSPVMGFARDGYPIFGPYDDKGVLQHAAAYGGDLDECNGKVDSKGNYGYYLTVDPPFAPPCLRGEKGSLSYYTTDIVCPANGIANTVIHPDSVVAKCETASFNDVGDCVEDGKFEDDSSEATGCLASVGVTAGAAIAGAVLAQL